MALLPGIHTATVASSVGPVTWYDSDPVGRDLATLVLLHGTSGSAESSYWALFPMLALRHRVVVFDFVDPAAAPGSEHYLAQAEAVVRAASPDSPVHVVGYSFGAVIAAQLAGRSPALVRSLTLIAGWMVSDAHQRLRNDVWQTLHGERSAAMAPFSLLTFFSQSFINAKTVDEIAALAKTIGAGPDRSVKMLFNRQVDIAADVARIEAPTLVVGCTHDFMVPIRHARLLFGAIRDSRFVEIAAGHGVAVERPSELFAVIHAFVTDPGARPAGTIIENAHA